MPPLAVSTAVEVVSILAVVASLELEARRILVVEVVALVAQVVVQDVSPEVAVSLSYLHFHSRHKCRILHNIHRRSYCFHFLHRMLVAVQVLLSCQTSASRAAAHLAHPGRRPEELARRPVATSQREETSSLFFGALSFGSCCWHND